MLGWKNSRCYGIHDLLSDNTKTNPTGGSSEGGWGKGLGGGGVLRRLQPLTHFNFEKKIVKSEEKGRRKKKKELIMCVYMYKYY